MNTEKLSYLIVDVDDTIAIKTNRHKYDWTKVDTDAPKQHVIDIINHLLLDKNLGLIILTARNEGFVSCPKSSPDLKNYRTVCRDLTIEWLSNYIKRTPDEVIMKPAESFENSSDFKTTAIQKIIDSGKNIEMIFEDNQSVVDAIKVKFKDLKLIQIH